MAEEVVLRFNDVSFEYIHKKLLLDETHFVAHKGAKLTLMGQNGAGKSTLFSLIRGEQQPSKGNIFIAEGATVASANQTMAREDLALTVEEYFAKAFVNVPGDLERKIKNILEVVNLSVPLDKKVGDFSGGQQARLLLAFALIQNPDIEVLIEGHTDNVPYSGTTILDNWDLSVKRATAIVRILQNKGVKPQQITAAGRSEYIPVQSNSTSDGKAKNRRIEIILTPNLDKINKLLGE